MKKNMVICHSCKSEVKKRDSFKITIAEESYPKTRLIDGERKTYKDSYFRTIRLCGYCKTALEYRTGAYGNQT